MAVYAPPIAQRQPFGKPPPINAHGVPAGTFAPGTKIQVGNSRVVIEKYLSEGGFAHVYVVKLPNFVDHSDLAVLKRVAVPDKTHLAAMRTEVETMKKLRGHRRVVKYMDSHASQISGGGYEVFLLMEFCNGGGLIDFMNTRLQNRLTEPEILKIFSDVAEGVACMHYLKPPLLHRDLKVENVLISTYGTAKAFKVCDFGSAALPRSAATTAAEGRLIEDDIQQHTTMQYRSPEMIDVYRKQPIDEKSDIWALGVLLYKLCYYTTPFESAGQNAILNAKFKYPSYPPFSDELKLLIATMLKEQPSQRPNIYQILKKACDMQNKPVPIKDIYSGRSQSETRKPSQPITKTTETAKTGASLASASKEAPKSLVPDIEPMRRGRPTKPSSHHPSAQPSPSPLRMIEPPNQSDPFASLDRKIPAADELSSKFPTLNEFALMSNEKDDFSFGSKPTVSVPKAEADLLSARVTQALADDAFARAPSPAKPTKPAPIAATTGKSAVDRKKSLERRQHAASGMDLPSPTPRKPSHLIAANSGSSSALPPSFAEQNKSRPIHRFPAKDPIPRPSSQPWGRTRPAPGQGSRLASLVDQDKERSQSWDISEPRSPASSRPSLEISRPTPLDLSGGVNRSKTVAVRNRPASVQIGQKLDVRPSADVRKKSLDAEMTSEAAKEQDMAELTAVVSDTNIENDLDFLRAREEEERQKQKHHQKDKRHSSSGSRHGKRASLPHIALSGTKNLLTGRFGDAFKKFENHGHHRTSSRDRSPSPSRDHLNSLTPIAGSVATDLSDDHLTLLETEDLSPEMRREIEIRQLQAEEKRVEQAQAEYRQKVADGSGARGGPQRAAIIQNKVHSLLSENDRPVQKNAAGYGRFTDASPAAQVQPFQSQPASKPLPSQPLQAQPLQALSTHAQPLRSPNPSALQTHSEPTSAVGSPPSAHGGSIAPPRMVQQRPTAPPKPQVLRRDVTASQQQPQPAQYAPTQSIGESLYGDDWESQFSKKYPSLAGLEMVEADVGVKQTPVRTKEV